MSRWEPGARGRLEQAAMELFTELGFERTTVAEIAARAGLTERTFYRHFADKREVLFPDASPLIGFFEEALDGAPAGAAPMDVVAAVLEQTAAYFADRREFSRRRSAVVASSAELRERELVKLAALTDTVAEGLRRRGVGEPAASLAADAGIAVFKFALAQWTSGDERDLWTIMRGVLDELGIVWAAPSQGGR